MNEIDSTFMIWLVMVWLAIGAACITFWVLAIKFISWVFT